VEGAEQIMTTEELYSFIAKGNRLFDRTYSKQNDATFRLADPALPPSCCSHTQQVEEINKLLSETTLDDYLTTLSSTYYWNRFYTSNYGVKSAEWIFNQYEQIIRANELDGIQRSVQFFNHTWPQPSVIARIEGTGSNNNELVIIGAHEDSVNWQAQNQDISRAPGAVDDGSGTVTVMEVFRVMAESGSVFSRTIEFHHYAAEEVGLLGSQDIADYYAAQGIPVVAYLNFDMDGVPGNPALFSLITDYTNADLNNFVIELISAYTSLSYQTGICGYACSDHASWNRTNYRSSFAIENGPYSHAHTSGDDIAYVDFTYMVQYAQLGVGFLVEIASYVDTLLR
jgi:leucyl aminopeptidase